METYFFFGPPGDDPQPVSYHAEDGGEVGQSHQDPEPHPGFVVVLVFYLRATYRYAESSRSRRRITTHRPWIQTPGFILQDPADIKYENIIKLILSELSKLSEKMCLNIIFF